MVKTFNVKEAIKLDYKDRWICPDCKDHKQGDATKYYDCKNVFVNDLGNSVGQCCCYSEVHGIRKEDNRATYD